MIAAYVADHLGIASHRGHPHERATAQWGSA
jgi:hypothetical protein